MCCALMRIHSATGISAGDAFKSSNPLTRIRHCQYSHPKRDRHCVTAAVEEILFACVRTRSTVSRTSPTVVDVKSTRPKEGIAGECGVTFVRRGDGLARRCIASVKCPTANEVVGR